MNHSTRVNSGRPTELLALIPHLLGYQPKDCVTITLARDGQLDMSCAIPAELLDDATIRADTLAMVASSDPRALVLVAAWSQDLKRARRWLDDVLLELDPLRIAGAWWTDGQRWSDPVGRHGTLDGADFDRVVRSARAAGLTVLPDRQALADRIAGPGIERQQELLAHFNAARQRSEGLSGLDLEARVLTLVQHGLASTPPIDVLVELAVLVSVIPARDAAWMSITRATAEQHVALWQAVVDHSLDRYAMPPICLLGVAGWIAGQGALLNVCAERGRRLNPGYSMLHILEDLSAHAVNPALWDSMRDRRGG